MFVILIKLANLLFNFDTDFSKFIVIFTYCTVGILPQYYLRLIVQS